MRRSQLILLGILLCGAFMRIPMLNLPVSYDEAYTYIAFARQNWFGILSDYSLPNNHILHSLLVKAGTGLLGNHPWSLRLPAFFAGLAAIPLVYLLGKRLFNPATALAASALVAWLPAIVRYDTVARGYSLISFFTLLAWLLALLALETGRLRYWLGLSASIALGFFTIPTMALPAGGIYLWIFGETLLRREKRGAVYLRWFASGLVSGLLTFLLYLPVLLVSGWRKLLANSFVVPVEREVYFSKVLWRQLSATWDLWNLDTPLALSLLLVLGIVLSLAFSRWNAATRLHLAAPMLLWITLYVFLRRPNAFDRFWAFLLAPAMLWAAAGWLATASPLRLGRFRASDLLSAASVLALVIVAATSLPSIPEKWNKVSNIEAMAIELQPGLQDGDMVLIGYPNDTPLWYYLSRLGVDDSAWQARPDFERAFVLISTNYGQTPEGVIRERKLDPALFDLAGTTHLGKIGPIEAYLIYPAPSK
jgi:4-amino-4-deoxy-L-arabinose transferase-like glycosyltransferase